MPDVVALPAHPVPPPARGRVVGLDLGTRRIGVSVSDSDRRLALGVTAIDRRDPEADTRRIAALVTEYGAVTVVVGMPLSLSGDHGPAARAAVVEVQRIRDAVGVPVDTVDERLTTVQAAGALRAGGRRARQQRGVIDQEAAAGLLQTWLDQHRDTGT